MKQRIEPHERENIKRLLLSGEEKDYRIALQLLSIFFDKREARRFIWYECLSCYVVPTLIGQIRLYKDTYEISNYKEDYNQAKENLLACVKKWIHSGNRDAAFHLYSGLNMPRPSGELLNFIAFL